MVNEYPVGAPVVLRVQWTDTDPSSPTFGQVVLPTVAASATGPNEGSQTLVVTGPDAQGWYTARVTPDVKGFWSYAFSCSGTYTGFAQDMFRAVERRSPGA